MRRYRAGGLDSLRDKPRPQRGVEVLAPDEIERILQLKRDVPERSLDRLLKIAEDAGVIQPGQTSHGRPRTINQLAMQSFIQAAVVGRDTIDGEFLAHLIAAHPLYQSQSHGQER